MKKSGRALVAIAVLGAAATSFFFFYDTSSI